MKKTISLLLITFFVFNILFPCPAFSAQEGFDIADPEEIRQTVAEQQAASIVATEIIVAGEDYQLPYIESDQSEVIIVRDDVIIDPKAKKEEIKLPLPVPAFETEKNDEEGPWLPRKIQEIYKKVASFSSVIKTLDKIESIWEKIKKFVSGLPGIKHYLNSRYSRSNYKKELGHMSTEASAAKDKAVSKKEDEKALKK